MRTFYACTFTPGGYPYTYHWDSHEQLPRGCEVAVPDADADEPDPDEPDDWRRVTVVRQVEAPDFPTKPILGRLKP